MPDGRFLSRSIAVNERLSNVSFEADYLYTRCIPHLDVDGRLSANPKVLKAMVAPLRDEITPETIPLLLTELDRVGLVVWYELDGHRFLEFPGFREHQKGLKPEREAPSKIPSSQSQGVQRVRGIAGPTPDLVRTNSGLGPPKVSEVKVSRVEVSGVESRKEDTPRKQPRGDANGSSPSFALGPYLDAHRLAFPGSQPPAARFGKVFKRLEHEHGAEETLRRWTICLARKATFATPEELSSHWSAYDTQDAPRAPPDTRFAHLAGYPDLVRDGVMTDYGERVTRPDGVRSNPYADTTGPKSA